MSKGLSLDTDPSLPIPPIPSTLPIPDEATLIAVARRLCSADTADIAESPPLLTRSEHKTDVCRERGTDLVDEVRRHIRAGHDPLGAAYCQLRSPQVRRQEGAVYTPPALIEPMLAWSAATDTPDRIVDPGAGSGRFIVAAGQQFPRASLVAVELDPLAALLTRANLSVHGLSDRASVIVADYTQVAGLGDFTGKTLYIGNPPYVRHHQIDKRGKQWLTEQAKRYGLKASQLAGLHVHFFAATVGYARKGDYGTFVTAAEWLDVHYGALVRKLFLGQLGGTSLHVIEPKAQPFADAQTTGAITCFQVGQRPTSIYMQRVTHLDELGSLAQGRNVARAELDQAQRWTVVISGKASMPRGYMELGELCRVHRGQATGANKFWIAGPHAQGLPASVLYPTITRAKELYNAGRSLQDTSHLRRVIDLPVDLDGFSQPERRAIETFLEQGRHAGVDQGYIARHRPAWWSVGLRTPAPILATYMARRPPGFVRNRGRARHINIAHGLYPREATMSSEFLDQLVAYLATQTSISHGRTYAGGLTKFEPGEMARIPVPSPDELMATDFLQAP